MGKLYTLNKKLLDKKYFTLTFVCDIIITVVTYRTAAVLSHYTRRTLAIAAYACVASNSIRAVQTSFRETGLAL
jgi:hypothetical protein